MQAEMQMQAWRHADSCPCGSFHPGQCEADPPECSCGLSDLLAALDAGPVVIDRGVMGRLELAHTIKPAHPDYWTGDDDGLGDFYRIIPPDDHVPGSSEEE